MVFDDSNAVLDSKLSKWVTFFPVILLSALVASSGLSADLKDLTPNIKRGSVASTQCVVEVEGELKLNPDGKQVTKMPFQVRADLTYDERYLAAVKPGELAQTARYYHKAEANLRLGDSDFASTLRPEVRAIVCAVHDGAPMLFALGEHLTREELDLIDVQGNSAQLHRLLPEKPVTVGDTWQISEGAIAGILGIESVLKSEITAKYAEQDKDLAIIDLFGTVSGAIGGVSTDIDLKGKCNFDVKRRVIVWLAIHIKEDRAIGHAEPGFDVEARIRVAVTPRDSAEQLSERLISTIPAKVDGLAGILAHVSERSEFKLLHDRGWRVMADRHDVTILRLVQRGDLIAQCNISKIANSDRQLTLEQFQAEVQKALGKNFGRIVEGTEQQTSNGNRVLRVVANGTTSELPIQWIYCHISGTGGKRAAMVFTFEASLAERFGGFDQTMIESFQFQSTSKQAVAQEPNSTAKKNRK